MKNKQIAILGLIFVVLLLLVQGLSYLNRDQGKPQVKKIFSFSADQIDQIDLTSPEESVSLRSVDGIWQLTAPVNAEANATYVASLLNAIVNLTTDGTSSNNPDNQDTYQVSDATGLKVTVYGQGQTLATFYLGKTSSDYSHTYVRTDGSNTIKTAKGSLAATFDRTSGDWRNKVITSLPADTLQSIIVSRAGAAPYTLIRDQGGAWTVSSDGTLLDQTRITTLLDTLTALNATDFVADDATLGLDLAQPSLNLTVQTTSSSLTLQMYSKDGKYYATLNNGPQIYVIAQFAFDSLDKPASDLI